MSPVKKKVIEPGAAAAPAKVPAKRGRKPKSQTVAPTVPQALPVGKAQAGAVQPVSPIAAAATKPRVAHSKKYFYAVGRRKSAIAQVRLHTGKGDLKVNDLELSKYFPTLELQAAALAPLNLTNQLAQVALNAKVYGGGKRAQADSVRHGLARALVLMNIEFKPTLKKMGFLTRDSRVKERKKYGLKGARRAPQWQKR